MSKSIPVQVNRCIRGETVGTTGTGIFTLWSDIKNLSTKSTVMNPYAIEYSTLANDDRAYILDVPVGYNWLDAYQMLINAAGNSTQITISQALKGVFFGKFPLHNAGERHQHTPREAGITGWSAALGAAGDVGGGIWLPLDNPVSGDTEFTFPTNAALLFQNNTEATSSYPNIGGLTSTTASSIRAHSVTARTSVFVGGASRVMFLPTQVANLSAGEGVLVGRFVM